MKKAFLVTANVTTRVVVDVPDTIDEFAYDKIIKQAKEGLIHNLTNDYRDQIEDVREDNPAYEKEKTHYICPECGTHFKQGCWNYNYDTGKLDFECPLCDWVGTEDDVDIDNEK